MNLRDHPDMRQPHHATKAPMPGVARGAGTFGLVWSAHRNTVIKSIRHDVTSEQFNGLSWSALREADFYTRMARASAPFLTHKYVELAPSGSVRICLPEMAGDLASVTKLMSPTSRWRHAPHILFRLLSALRELHRHGIIHGDIKPQNVVCNRSLKVVKLCDFGTCCYEADAPRCNMCTYPFSAPEARVSKPEPHTTQVDVFGVAATLVWYLVRPTLREHAVPPWQTLLQQVDLASIVSAASLASLAPLVTLLQRMLDPNPLVRPTAEEAWQMDCFDHWRQASTCRPLTLVEFSEPSWSEITSGIHLTHDAWALVRPSVFTAEQAADVYRRGLSTLLAEHKKAPDGWYTARIRFTAVYLWQDFVAAGKPWSDEVRHLLPVAHRDDAAGAGSGVTTAITPLPYRTCAVGWLAACMVCSVMAFKLLHDMDLEYRTAGWQKQCTQAFYGTATPAASTTATAAGTKQAPPAPPSLPLLYAMERHVWRTLGYALVRRSVPRCLSLRWHEEPIRSHLMSMLKQGCRMLQLVEWLRVQPAAGTAADVVANAPTVTCTQWCTPPRASSSDHQSMLTTSAQPSSQCPTGTSATSATSATSSATSATSADTYMLA